MGGEMNFFDISMFVGYLVTFACATFMILNTHVKDGVTLKVCLIVLAVSSLASAHKYMMGGVPVDPEEAFFNAAVAAVAIIMVARVFKRLSLLLDHSILKGK